MAKERRLRRQRRGGGGTGRRGGGGRRGGAGGRGGGGGRGGAAGQQGGIGAHLVDVDVGGVEQDVVLAAEAGEDGGDARHQLGERGPALRLGVPALDHHRVPAGRGGGATSGGEVERRMR